MLCFLKKILLAVLLLAPVSAWAGFQVCNDTTQEREVAFAHRVDGIWKTQGWFPVPVEDCVELIKDDLSTRFLYVRVKDQSGRMQQASVKFCASNDPFSGAGSDNCHAQRLHSLDFARINVGRGNTEARVQLSSYLPEVEVVPAKTRNIKAVFQSCVPSPTGEGKICSFVGTKKEFFAQVNENSPRNVVRTVSRLHHGAPVNLRAQVTHKFLGSKEVYIEFVERRPADQAHEMLVDLQGTWVSKHDPNDSFTVEGASRINAYAGVETTREFMSISDHCLDFSFTGFALHSWSKDDGDGLCYEVEALTEDTLTLLFLPSGRILEYVRIPNS